MATSATPGLSMIQASRDYVARMVTDVAGMKVLVMDAETTGFVSIVYTKTQILQVRRLRAARERAAWNACITLLCRSCSLGNRTHRHLTPA